jgi:hypothetical protein
MDCPKICLGQIYERTPGSIVSAYYAYRKQRLLLWDLGSYFYFANGSVRFPPVNATCSMSGFSSSLNEASPGYMLEFRKRRPLML